jgi:hypothetical protein
MEALFPNKYLDLADALGRLNDAMTERNNINEAIQHDLVSLQSYCKLIGKKGFDKSSLQAQRQLTMMVITIVSIHHKMQKLSAIHETEYICGSRTAKVLESVAAELRSYNFGDDDVTED